MPLRGQRAGAAWIWYLAAAAGAWSVDDCDAVGFTDMGLSQSGNPLEALGLVAVVAFTSFVSNGTSNGGST